MLDGIDFGGQDQRFGVDIYSDFLNYYDQNNAPKRLGEELRAAGNDVIILDFPDANGTEYIQRNAFVLIQLIQNVNADLRSRSSTPEQLTVIGPSMSGLVSRYALAYMEKKFNDVSDPNTYQKPEWNHNTRLWVSFDSPQLGANVPIGDQQWLQYYAEVLDAEAAKQNLGNLDTPAAREMLVHHYRSPDHTVSGAPGFRDQFQAELEDLGMPAQLRRIAVVNGSISGVRQDWRDNSRKSSGCDQAFSFEAKTGSVRLFYIPFLRLPTLIPTMLSSSRVGFSPDYGASCVTFIGGALGKTSWVRYATGRQSSVSHDVAPGSWRDTQGTLAKEGTFTDANISGFFQNVFLGGFHQPSQTTRFDDVVEKHCFIPTTSALALTNSNRDLAQNLSATDLVCSGETPFDSYFAPLQNEEHVTVTAANAAYIKKEIASQVATPVFAEAPTAICPFGGTLTFRVKQECVVSRPGSPVTTYNWTVTAGGTFMGNVQQVTNAGPSQVVVVGPAPSNTNVTVSVVAVRAGATASDAVTTNVHITDANATTTAPGEVQKYDVFNAVFNQENAIGPYTWSITPPFKASILNPGTANGETVRIRANNAGQITITASGTDACTGATLTSSIPVTITTGGLRPALEAVAYPNPADAVLNLTAPEAANAVGPRTVVLYNGQGREVRRTTGTGIAQLPTADLPTGLYYLMTEQSGQVTRCQIRVQH